MNLIDCKIDKWKVTPTSPISFLISVMFVNIYILQEKVRRTEFVRWFLHWIASSQFLNKMVQDRVPEGELWNWYS